MHTNAQYLTAAGRILLAAIFLISGIGKISAYEATAGYMSSAGVPGFLLPLVIVFEIAAAVALIAGYRARVSAFALAAFSVLTALLFHSALEDQTQFIMFWKNIAIAGGLFVVVANGAGGLALDNRFKSANKSI